MHRRSALAREYRREAARRMAAAVLSLPAVATARTVGLYADLRGEASTARLAHLLCLSGKAVALPVTGRAAGSLVFRRVRHRHDLQPGPFGLREPGPHCPETPPASLDVIIVPGVGFDRRGVRLGFGAGYYDRYLPLLRPDCLKIGLAFACQVVAELPRDPHDQGMDVIVTEEGMIAPAR